MSDVGVQVASNLTEELRYEARLENAKKPDALKRVIIEKLVDLYEKDGQFNEAIRFQDGLTVMLFVGVNGVGKTTSIGKLAHRYKQEGKNCLLYTSRARISGRGSIAWKPFRRTIVTSMQASRAFCKKQNG